MTNADAANDGSDAVQSTTAGGETSGAEVGRQESAGMTQTFQALATQIASAANMMLDKYDAEAVPNDGSDAAQKTAMNNDTGVTSTGTRGQALLSQIPRDKVVVDVLNQVALDVADRVVHVFDGMWADRLKEKDVRLQNLESDLKDSEAKRRARLKSFSEMVRSIALLLVLLAIVGAPLVIIFRSPTTPEQFAQYMAPITGIAGAIIGYWFGKYEPKS